MFCYVKLSCVVCCVALSSLVLSCLVFVLLLLSCCRVDRGVTNRVELSAPIPRIELVAFLRKVWVRGLGMGLRLGLRFIVRVKVRVRGLGLEG